SMDEMVASPQFETNTCVPSRLTSVVYGKLPTGMVEISDPLAVSISATSLPRLSAAKRVLPSGLRLIPSGHGASPNGVGVVARFQSPVGVRNPSAPTENV